MSNVPGGPPPVEPMSDVAWARVERGLMQRLDAEPAVVPPLPSRRRWMWIAAPAFAVAATIALVIGLRGGTQEVAPSEPSRVVAGDAPSSVSFGDAHLALAANSAIVMTQERGAPSVLVERGAVRFTVAPRAERPAFVVRAGDVVVRVVGTRFEVSRSDERVAVAVDHGIVDVIFRGATMRVAAGQRWTSEAPEATTTIAMAAPPAAPPAPTASATVDTPTPTPTPTPTVKTSPLPARAPIPTASPRSTTTATVPVVEASPSPTTMPAAPSATVESEQAKYERLTKLEAKDATKALAGYLQLSSGSSEWAAIGLYAAGRLAADRNDPRARTFLEIYLRRFPSGANADDAKTLLDRLQGAHP